jgi:uncharacterized phage-like protein YoqJ/uncharacterized protein YeaO (DUF488 family)
MPQETALNQNPGNIREELTILITGDKPKNLLAENSQGAALAYSKQMSDALESISERALGKIVEGNPGKRIVLLSGLELGMEQAATRRAVEMGIEVRAFISHREHGKNWSLENQTQYQELTRRIAENGGTIQTSDKEYSPQRTQLRDYRMIDEAQTVISLHNPNEKPAHQKTLDYAAKHSKSVVNIWNDAEKILSEVSKNFDKQTPNSVTAKSEQTEKINRSAIDNQTPRKIEIRERITREDVRAENDKIFLFGDNLKQIGFGGQAKEMRGEPNVVGIPTKKEPANNQTSFFTDKEFEANRQAIDQAFGKIAPGKTVVVPKGGIGTGLARLEEKAPRTFAYLNEKLADLGFDNRRGCAITLAPKNENRVVIQNSSEKLATQTRLLDLNNIQTESLKLLSPSEKEVAALTAAGRGEALSGYAERLRADYKENRNGLRDGMRALSDALDKGEQITVACACRNGEMCHADVVKMAIEKINLHIKSQQIRETNKGENESRITQSEQKNDSQKQENKTNPRTQRAIAEIIAVSETDKLLEKINETDGRNQSDQATHLGRLSQFVRDVYERGGNVIDGKLIVPKENLTFPAPLAVTTQNYAVGRLAGIVKDESKAKELAPQILDYGNKIAGGSADGETKLKVFAWMYDALEGKIEFLPNETNKSESREQKFENALAEISRLADEMHELEPADKIEFAPLNDFELENQTAWDERDENSYVAEIYENAIGRDVANETIEHSEQILNEQNERGLDLESASKIAPETFERIDLSDNAPRLPAEFTEAESARLLTETLPEIDRQLESGVSVKEILKPFHENVRQSARFDTLNRLETIYQKQKISELEIKLSSPQLSMTQKEKLESEISRWQNLVLTPSWETQRDIIAGVRENDFKGKTTVAKASGKNGELGEAVRTQIEKIDVRRQNVITLGSPSEFLAAIETAEKTFYQKTKTETADLRLKLAETTEAKENSVGKENENALKKQLNELRNLKPSFAFKLENSNEIIFGQASTTSLEERAFVASYVNFQLQQPETRFRHENERYRVSAAKLEAAGSRDEVIKAASDIRAENAALGLKWKDLSADERAKQPRPLTDREMRFLFTETSPAHYTPEMTVARLSFAHSGESRRQATESLLRGEIKPSPETQKLIDSLEARLERRELKDSISATKHFFESLKTPNENLKYKNDFEHQEIYRKLPPQEKDFVYARATSQRENLEYRLAFKQRELIKGDDFKRDGGQPKLEQSSAEKSFHLLSRFNQARVLGERVETSALVTKEISERDFRAVAVVLQNQPGEKISALGKELKQSGQVEDKKIGEILESFSKAEVTKSGDKTVVEIKLPEKALVGAETYKELLERFYPNDKAENDKFKFSSFHEKTIEAARIKAQDETLENKRAEVGNNIYTGDARATQTFQTERGLIEDLTNVAELQRAARDARDENTRILEKYASRTAFKMEKEQSVVPQREDQKQVVETALHLSLLANHLAAQPTNQKFFETVQMEIAVSDFQKFGANEKIIAANQADIRKTFSEIAAKEIILEENRIKPLEIRADEKLLDVYFKTQQAEENRLLTDAARTAFEQNETQNWQGKSIVDLVSETQRNEIKIEAADKARIALEPEYKNLEEKEYNEQALKLADAIEKAHELNKAGANIGEIRQAFEIAENERAVLQEADSGVKKIEDKPLSLRLYEAEIGRAEKELWTKNLSAKILAGVSYSESELTLNLDKIFSAQEREQIKLEAAEIAKTRLEPKELDADHRKIPTEAGRQALSTFKQLEQAHNVFQFSNDSAKIHEAFFKLDREAATLNQFRQNYDKNEKLALLKEGVKTDLIDLLKKDQNLKGGELAMQTGEILRQNFAKVGFSNSTGIERQTEILSREISEKIEAKQSKATKENAVLHSRFPQAAERNLPLDKHAPVHAAREQNAKESFVLTR